MNKLVLYALITFVITGFFVVIIIGLFDKSVSDKKGRAIQETKHKTNVDIKSTHKKEIKTNELSEDADREAKITAWKKKIEEGKETWPKRFAEAKEKYKEIFGAYSKAELEGDDDKRWELNDQLREQLKYMYRLIHEYYGSYDEKCKIEYQFNKFIGELREKHIAKLKGLEERAKEYEDLALGEAFDEMRLRRGYISVQEAMKKEPLELIEQYLKSDNENFRSYAYGDLDWIRDRNIEKFTPQVIDELFNIFKFSPYSDAQERALRLLVEIPKVEPNKIQEILKEAVLLPSKSEDIKDEAISRITDEKFLMNILQNKTYSSKLRATAAREIIYLTFDKKEAKDIFSTVLSLLKSDTDPKVRYEIANKLESDLFIFKPDLKVDLSQRRMIPEGRTLEIMETLKWIIENDPSEEVKKQAKKSLDNLDREIQRSDYVKNADKEIDENIQKLQTLKSGGFEEKEVNAWWKFLQGNIPIEVIWLIQIDHYRDVVLPEIEGVWGSERYIKFFGKDKKYQTFENALKEFKEYLEKQKEKYKSFEKEREELKKRFEKEK